MRTLLLFIVLGATPLFAHAGMLEAHIAPGVDGARVIILVSATTTPINALEGTLTLPSGARADKLYIGESVIQTWVEAPRIEEGKIRFAGVIPGGFTGSAVPGSGLTGPAELFSFEIVGPITPFLLSGGASYLNNGQGTRVMDGGGTLPEFFVSGSMAQEEDRTPPEFLDVASLQTETLAEGRPILAIDSFDAGSGIDRFEVQEGKGAWSHSGGVYEVQDSWGFSSLSVRAYDRAGNFIEKKIAGRNAPYLYLGYALLALFVLSIVSGALVYWRKRRART
jgi:hypothetical protein